MNPSGTNITANASRAVPPDNVYMIGHIGNNDELDHSQSYTKAQKKIIDQNNSTLYQRTEHDATFDLPESGYNPIQNNHPLGINMVANHSNAGFDYRDFPKELANRREIEGYDPYIAYLHEQGLIGKHKSRYNTQYINVDSSSRTTQPQTTTSTLVQLTADPLSINGTEVRIALSDTSAYTPNDKITLSGIQEKSLTLRSFVTDDFGNTINYFKMTNGLKYMTVTADNNMNINSSLTRDLIETYSNITISFDGFVGDTKTQWYFN